MAHKLSNEITKYYLSAGPSAWLESQIPYAISSNTFLARYYADLIASFIEDGLQNSFINPQHPVPIIELGAGHGLFTHYLLQALEEKTSSGLFSLNNIQYICTDLVNENILYCQNHDCMQPYIKQKILDFSCWNANNDTDIHLCLAKKSLTRASVHNPIVVIANYVFDSLNTDCFKILNNKLFYVNIQWIEENGADLAKNKFDFKLKACRDNLYYSNKNYQQILDHYLNTFDQASFSIPIGAIQAIERLQSLSASHQIVLFTGDKGYPSEDYFNNSKADPHLSKHRTVSLMVNFHALAFYFNEHSGTQLTQNYCENLTYVVACFSSLPPVLLPRLRLRYQETIGTLSIEDVYNIIFKPDYSINKDILNSLNRTLSLLSLIHWDPLIFDAVHNILIEQIESLDLSSHKTLLHGLQKIETYYYHMSDDNDVYYALARVYYHLTEYRHSLVFCEKSLQIVGDFKESLYCAALCSKELDDTNKAKEYLLKTLAISSDYEPAVSLLEQLNNC